MVRVRRDAEGPCNLRQRRTTLAIGAMRRETCLARRSPDPSGWAVAEQALSSPTNFALGLFAATVLDATAFGAFCIVIATCTHARVRDGPIACASRKTNGSVPRVRDTAGDGSDLMWAAVLVPASVLIAMSRRRASCSCSCRGPSRRTTRSERWTDGCSSGWPPREAGAPAGSEPVAAPKVIWLQRRWRVAPWRRKAGVRRQSILRLD